MSDAAPKSDLVDQVLASGRVFAREAIADGQHGLLGYAVVNVDSLKRASLREMTPRGDSEAPTDAAVQSVLAQECRALADRLVGSVSFVTRHSGHVERPPEPDANVKEEALAFAARRNALFVRVAPLAIMSWLERPVNQVLSERPRLELEGVMPPEHVLTFAEYVFGAVRFGDPAALNAITSWMKQNVRKRPKSADWPHIRRVYVQTLQQLQEARSTVGEGGDSSLIRQYYEGTEIGRRLQSHGLLDAALKAKPADIARELVALEHRMSAKTLKRRMGARRARSTKKATRPLGRMSP